MDESLVAICEFRASDGYLWRYRRYLPVGEPRGAVVCLHGIQSHGGWYMTSCVYLAKIGYQVDFLDRRGSGLNLEQRGDTPSFRRLLLDISEFIDAQYPQKPHLCCISWGAKLGVALEYFHPGKLRSLALLAPGLCPKIGPTAWQRVRILLGRIFTPGRLYPVPLDDPALFTDNPVRQQFIREDSLALRQATARFLVESVRLDIVLRRACRGVQAPLFLMLAGKDRIVDNAKTRAFIERCPAAQRQVVEFPEAHHTLEFEEDPTPVFSKLRDWYAMH